ncbi:MAG: hypothetical protein EXR87_02825 [Gammaproteobacteria bacterium]|nr:hypothetical protein [Gammaproteobacteria bacterium]
MKFSTLRPCLAALVVLLLSACTETNLSAQAQLPPPLIDRLPARVGIYYSKEFREYVHKETRSEIDYAITLGPAHVQNLDWLLKAMFAEVVQIEDPTRVAELQPPLVMVLEPRFEEYSFLTPKDVAGEAFIVTIRYLLTVYDGSGGRVDAFTFTGYGREKVHQLASKEPLQIATQRAMRDAGAKVAVEFTDQESVRLLLRNPGELFAPPPATVVPASTVVPTPTAVPPPAETPTATEELPPSTGG